MYELELGDPVQTRTVSERSLRRPREQTPPQSLGDHQRSPKEEDERSVVYIDPESLLERHDESTRQSRSPSSGSLDPSTANTVGHDADEEERRGDGHALKVLGLARLVLGDQGDGGVEAGEASDTGADEDGEEGGVGGGAEAYAEGAHGGGDTEGDLLCYKKVSLSRRVQMEERTESASESSSCPSIEDSFLQRATLPSRASKIIPARGKARACLLPCKMSARRSFRRSLNGSGSPEVPGVGSEEVARRGEEREGAAEAIAEGDEVSEAEIPTE